MVLTRRILLQFAVFTFIAAIAIGIMVFYMNCNLLWGAGHYKVTAAAGDRRTVPAQQRHLPRRHRWAGSASASTSAVASTQSCRSPTT